MPLLLPDKVLDGQQVVAVPGLFGVLPGEPVQVLALRVLAQLELLDGAHHGGPLLLGEPRASLGQDLRVLIGPEKVEPRA